MLKERNISQNTKDKEIEIIKLLAKEMKDLHEYFQWTFITMLYKKCVHILSLSDTGSILNTNGAVESESHCLKVTFL